MMARFFFSLGRATDVKNYRCLVNNKSTIMSMVCTFSDHRNDQEMVKTFKNLQRNLSPAAHAYTWVLNILTSLFSMVYKSTDHGKLHAVDLLVRHIGRVRKSVRGVALLPPTHLRGWRGIKKNDDQTVNWKLKKSFDSIHKNARGVEQILRTDSFLSPVSFALDGDQQESLKRKKFKCFKFSKYSFSLY